MERGCCVLLDEQRCTKNRAICDHCVLSVEQICVKDRLSCKVVRSCESMQLYSYRSTPGPEDVVVELCKLWSRAMDVGNVGDEGYMLSKHTSAALVNSGM